MPGPDSALTTGTGGHQDPDYPDASAVTSPEITKSQSAKFIIHSSNKDPWENLRGWNNYNPSLNLL